MPEKLRISLYDLVKPLKIRLSTCPDAISEAFADEAVENNVKVIELGVQSLSDKVLKMNKRTYLKDDVLNCFNLLNGRVDTSAQFMTGMYGEERADILETLTLIPLLKSTYSRIYPTIVLHETELSELYKTGTYLPPSGKETLLRASAFYITLTASRSKVIRTGLPPDIKSANIISGFWHPAAGDLVKTFIMAAYAAKVNKLPDINYNGYKGFINRNFSQIPIESSITDFDMLASELTGIYNASEQWFTEKQNIEIASELISQAYIR